MFLPHPLVKLSIVGSLRDNNVACSASDRQGSDLESCVWRAMSSHSSHHPQEGRLAQFRLYMFKSGIKPNSFHFIFAPLRLLWKPHALTVGNLHFITHICLHNDLQQLNPFKPEFTIVIFMHYKPRIAVVILSL